MLRTIKKQHWKKFNPKIPFYPMLQEFSSAAIPFYSSLKESKQMIFALKCRRRQKSDLFLIIDFIEIEDFWDTKNLRFFRVF